MTTRTRWLADVRADVNAARARATTLAEDIASVRDRANEQNRSLTDGENARIDRLQKGYDRALEEEAGYGDEAKGMLLELAQRSDNTEDGSPIRSAVHDASHERLTGRLCIARSLSVEMSAPGRFEPRFPIARSSAGMAGHGAARK